MKRPISFWIFGIMAMSVNFYIGYLFFPAFMMLTQYHLAMLLGNNYYNVFYSLLFLFSLSILVLLVGLFRLKKWAYYIFIILTLLINFLVSFIYIGELVEGNFNLRVATLILIISTVCFIVYFLKPSTRRMFKQIYYAADTDNAANAYYTAFLWKVRREKDEKADQLLDIWNNGNER